MSEYKGFRIWTKSFQTLSTESTGVTIELESDNSTPTGRLLLNGVRASYYPNSKYGVKALLEDTLAPLVDSNVNEVGWSLDTDLYARLNGLSESDPLFAPFKAKNPLLYTPSTPLGSKSMALVPCSYVYAMFFKHTSGHKLMVSYNYLAMHSYFSEETSSGGYNDAGWLYNHVHLSYRGSNNEQGTRIGGFMVSMLPPPREGDAPYEWHPEFSIRSENFYSPQMFPIVPQFASNTSYSSSNTASYGSASLIRQGTTEAYNGTPANKGCVVGTQSKVSVLADSKGNVGLCSAHNATYRSLPLLIIGPLFRHKIYDNDTLPQRMLCSINHSCSKYSGGSIDNSKIYCAWYSTETNVPLVLATEAVDGEPVGLSAYAAYAAMDASVKTNYRYSKAIYTVTGLIDEEVVRCSASDGLVLGQTINNGEWCYVQGFNVNSAPGTPSELQMLIRWDASFNGTETPFL